MQLTAATKKELQDPAGRSRLVDLLYENGVFSERSVACDFVTILGDQAAGVPLVPSMKKWLDEAQAMCAHWLKADAARASAWQEQRDLNGLRERKTRLQQEIALEKERLAELETWLAGAVSVYRSSIAGDRSQTFAIVLAAGKARCGAREAIRFSTEEIIPVLEVELKTIVKEISDYTAAIGANNNLPETNGA